VRGAVGIVGRGKIASALADGSSRRPDLRFALFLEDSLGELADRTDVVVIDVDPPELPATVDRLRPMLGDALTIVSAVPGLSLSDLRKVVGPGPALFRAVATQGTERAFGVVVLCTEADGAPALSADVARLLQCIGPVETVPEDMLEAAVAVAGSSVGFLALAMEGIEDGAVEAGLTRHTARAFVRQTALTAALLLRDHPGSPADLKDQVASPGGTTITGLAVLEEQAVRGALMTAMRDAVQAAM
jgi:pyrroline-5-carboxylate reductase